MTVKSLMVIFLFCSFNTDAQFLKNIDFEVSYGWMRNFNKKEINSSRFSSGLSSTTIDIKHESPIWTTKLTMSIGYTFKKNQIRIKYQKGSVGSRLTGSSSTTDDIGFTSANVLNGIHNILNYKSYGLYYTLMLPFGSDTILVEVGGSQQKNRTEDTFISIQGIIFTNYNISLSLGFAHSIIQNLEIVPRITVINSIDNGQLNKVDTDPRFVPIQIGFELGLRYNI